MPISGTSYAAPVVSGVAALVRSRFPELTARQVMHRIESTARTNGGVWTPLSGNGIVDPVAALSTEATTETATSEPAPRPISGPARTEPAPDTRASTIAISGAGICAVLVVAVAVARSRRGRGDDVMGGQRR
jgi:membrane-anchored mycosin MYCP